MSSPLTPASLVSCPVWLPGSPDRFDHHVPEAICCSGIERVHGDLRIESWLLQRDDLRIRGCLSIDMSVDHARSCAARAAVRHARLLERASLLDAGA